MSGYVDLHCHYVPGIDDGVRTFDETRRLLEGLKSIGYERVVATPHIRSGMFENRKAGLEKAFREIEELLEGSTIPLLGLASEHYFDDVFWGLFLAGDVLPYPGGHAILLEFHYERWPNKIDGRFFDITVKGLHPVIAHPERYAALQDETDSLDPLLEVGALSQLDVMSLVGRYGERSKRAAERMVEEGAYDLACSDAHRPDDVELVARGIERLKSLAGKTEAQELLSTNPRAILDGTYEP
jgi:protein-tyrosine phosphatase